MCALPICTWDDHSRLRLFQSNDSIILWCRLSTGSRANARGTAEHVLATWFDLNALKVGQEALRFVSLFDDTVDVWTEQEFKLLGEVSETAFWSKPEEFIDKIAA